MFPPRQFVGLDIGHANIRAVVLQRDQARWRIAGHALVHRRDAEGHARTMELALGELISQLDLKGPVCVALSEISALVRYVATIPLPADRLNRLLRLELQQNLEGAELAADTFPVPLAGDEIVHCCVLAQAAQIYDGLGELHKARINVGSIHFAPIAIYHTTLTVPPVSDDQIALLVDIGAVTTNVTMFGERRMLACRQLTIGGDTFARARTPAPVSPSPSPTSIPRQPAGGTAQGLGALGKDFAGGKPLSDLAFPAENEPALPQLDFDEPVARAPTRSPFARAAPAPAPAASIFADSTLELHDEEGVHGGTTLQGPVDVQQAAIAQQLAGQHPESAGTMGLELDLGQAQEISAQPSAGATAAAPVEPPVQLTDEQLRVAETLYSQLISSLAWFKIQIHARDITVVKVFLAGGGASVPGLVSYLERRFGVPVKLHDPCAGIEGEAPKQPHTWSTALGLAMTAARGAIPIDLTPDELLRKQAWRQRLIWPYVAAACLLLCGALITWTLINQQSVYAQSQDAYASFEKDYQAQSAKIKAAEAEAEGLGEDLRAIKSRLYAGQDLLYTIRAMKDRVIQSPELWVTNLVTHDISEDLGASAERTHASHSLSRPSAIVPTAAAPRPDIISRGAVDITGQVKFDSAKGFDPRNTFFDEYKKWLEAWSPGKNAPRLFGDARVLEYVNAEEKNRILKNNPRTAIPLKRHGPEDESDKGHFYFTFRLPFVPTQLLMMPAARDAVQVPAHAP